MAEEWGPWIKHDGMGCPVVGIYVRAEISNGTQVEGVASPRCADPPPGYASAWIWASLRADETWARVVRYRVRRPASLRRLIEIADDPLKGLPPRFPVEELA